MAKVSLERDGDVAILTISDPPLNLIGTEMIDQLGAALEEVHASAPRAFLMRAEGENFSAGAHVGELFQGRSAAEAHAFLSRANRLLTRAEELPFPTLAAVQGLCLTAGLEIALACDMIWAAESTRLGLVEAVIGTTPLGGGSYRLAERAGSARAREIVMTAGFYDATTFERWNVVNRVVPDGELQEKALRFAHRLAAGPTHAHAATKRLVREALDHGTRAADQLTPDVAAPLFETEDMRGGIESLLKHGPGKARFSGR